MGFFNSAEYTLREQTESISTFNHLSSRKYSFEKTNRILQGNNVVEAPGSKTDDFLSRDTCVSTS